MATEAAEDAGPPAGNSSAQSSSGVQQNAPTVGAELPSASQLRPSLLKKLVPRGNDSGFLACETAPTEKKTNMPATVVESTSRRRSSRSSIGGGDMKAEIPWQKCGSGMHVGFMHSSTPNRRPHMTSGVISAGPKTRNSEGNISVRLEGGAEDLIVPLAWFHSKKLVFYGELHDASYNTRAAQTARENDFRATETQVLHGGVAFYTDVFGRVKKSKPEKATSVASSGPSSTAQLVCVASSSSISVSTEPSGRATTEIHVRDVAALPTVGISVSHGRHLAAEASVTSGHAETPERVHEEQIESDLESNGDSETIHLGADLARHGDDAAKKVMESLGKATELLRTIEDDIKDLSLPLSALVGDKHATYLQEGVLASDDHVPSHIKRLKTDLEVAISPEVAQGLVAALKGTSEVFGKLQSHALRSHALGMRVLIGQLSADPSDSALYDAAQVGTVFVASALGPLVTLLKELTRPVHAPSDPRKREEQTLKSLDLIVQLLRNLVNRTLTFDKMDYAGTVLAKHLSPTDLDEFRRIIPVASSKQTAETRTFKMNASRLKEKGSCRDADCLLYGSDNFGKSAGGRRFETITHWRKQMNKSKIGSSIDVLLKSLPQPREEYVPMHKAGLEHPEDFVASSSDDDRLRFYALSHYDAAVSLPLLDLEEANSKFDLPKSRRVKVMKVITEEGAPKPRVVQQQNEEAEEGPTTFTRESIAVQETIPLPYANWVNVSDMVDGHVREAKAREAEVVIESGDGAPIAAMQKARRLAVAALYTKQLREVAAAEAAAQGQSQEVSASSSPPLGALSSQALQDEDCVYISSDSEGSGGEEEETVEEETADSDAAEEETSESTSTEKRPARRRVKGGEFSQKDIDNFSSLLVIVLGAWHCMQHMLLRSLRAFELEWRALGALFRGTWGKLNFFLSCGRLRECFVEMLSVALGLLKWWHGRYVSAVGTASASDWVAFDRFMDTDSSKYPVLRRLRELIESVFIVKAQIDSMKLGSYAWTRSMHMHVVEWSGATGGDTYVRMLCDYHITDRTMPAEHLVFVMEAFLLDHGSYFASVDEFTEFLNRLLRMDVGRVTGPKFPEACRRSSLAIEASSGGRNFGVHGPRRSAPPFGSSSVSVQVSSKIYHFMVSAFDFNNGTFIDTSGVERSLDEHFTIGGAEISAEQVDPQATGRAVVQRDVSAHVFGGTSAVLASSRKALERPLSMTDDVKSKANKMLRDASRDVAAVRSSFGRRKASYVQYLEVYENHANRPSRTIGNSTLHRQANATVETLAGLVARWRSIDRFYCEDRDKEVGAEKASMSADLKEDLKLIPSCLERREAARDRVSSRAACLPPSQKNRRIMTKAMLFEHFKGENASKNRSVALADLASPQRHHKRPGAAVTVLSKDRWENINKLSSAPKAANAMRVIARALARTNKKTHVRQSQLTFARSTARPREVKEALQIRALREAMSPVQSASYWNKDRMPPPASIGNALGHIEQIRRGEVAAESEVTPRARCRIKKKPKVTPSELKDKVMSPGMISLRLQNAKRKTHGFISKFNAFLDVPFVESKRRKQGTADQDDEEWLPTATPPKKKKQKKKARAARATDSLTEGHGTGHTPTQHEDLPYRRHFTPRDRGES